MNADAKCFGCRGKLLSCLERRDCDDGSSRKVNRCLNIPDVTKSDNNCALSPKYSKNIVSTWRYGYTAVCDLMVLFEAPLLEPALLNVKWHTWDRLAVAVWGKEAPARCLRASVCECVGDNYLYDMLVQ